MIAILDYGVGNLGSILNMLKRIGVRAALTTDPREIPIAEKVILPGVGNFDHCMVKLRESGFVPHLEEEVVKGGKPLLAICVGCQMLMERSEEGVQPGLGWLKGGVKRFDDSILKQGLKIPHMSWTDVRPVGDSPLFRSMEDPRFYFVHSYHLDCGDPSDVSGEATYGYGFPASVQKRNLHGVQFHPEKSHRFGMRLLENFSAL